MALILWANTKKSNNSHYHRTQQKREKPKKINVQVNYRDGWLTCANVAFVSVYRRFGWTFQFHFNKVVSHSAGFIRSIRWYVNCYFVSPSSAVLACAPLFRLHLNDPQCLCRASTLNTPWFTALNPYIYRRILLFILCLCVKMFIHRLNQ